MKTFRLIMILATVILLGCFNLSYAQSKGTEVTESPNTEEVYYLELVPAWALNPKLFNDTAMTAMTDTTISKPIFYRATDVQLMNSKQCVKWVIETETVKNGCLEYKWVNYSTGGGYYKCVKWKYKTVTIKKCVEWQ